MTTLPRAWGQGVGWGLSAALHAGVFGVLATGAAQAPRKSYMPARMNFDVVGPRATPAAPAPIIPKQRMRVRAEHRVESGPPPSLPPETAASEPTDLTGITLTSHGSGASWSSMVGNGARMDGAIAARVPWTAPALASSREPGTPRPRAAPGRGEPDVLPLADLSRRPVPPQLDAMLKGLYPSEARQRGVSGRAMVRARVEADGSVRIARVAFESFAGFGEACRKTVLGSSWLSPLDRLGRPVATEVTYTCRFEVER